MVLGDGEGVPLGVRLESASPQKLRLRTLRSKKSASRGEGRPRQKPKRVIADRGYDSDPLREQWKRRGFD
jgi:hypothetical protein